MRLHPAVYFIHKHINERGGGRREGSSTTGLCVLTFCGDDCCGASTPAPRQGRDGDGRKTWKSARCAESAHRRRRPPVGFHVLNDVVLQTCAYNCLEI